MKIDIFFRSEGCVHCEVQRGLWGGEGMTAGGLWRIKVGNDGTLSTEAWQ